MDRRLPVYLLIDVSGSMQGQPIESVKTGLDLMKDALESDPYALETVHVSVITFSSGANQLAPLTSLPDWTVPVLSASGNTDFIAGLELLLKCHQSDVTGSDWRPMVFILTDGAPDRSPSAELTGRFKGVKWGMGAGFACGPSANEATLRHLVETVYSLSSIDAKTMKDLFKWVSDSIKSVGKSNRLNQPNTPPEPPPTLTGSTG